ncbi:hypothetical protein ABKN59_005397 [Abortiporus biennis]
MVVTGAHKTTFDLYLTPQCQDIQQQSNLILHRAHNGFNIRFSHELSFSDNWEEGFSCEAHNHIVPTAYRSPGDILMVLRQL